MDTSIWLLICKYKAQNGSLLSRQQPDRKEVLGQAVRASDAASSLDTGKIELNKSLFNTKALLREISEELSLTTENHHITIACPEELSTHADRDKIASVISNLLSNAIKALHFSFSCLMLFRSSSR